MKKLDLGKGSALVVVAHPDDETIWMGGTILAHPQIQWTVFSLCRGDDGDRAPKFRKVCKFLGAKAIISDLEDEGIMDISASLPKIEKRILKELKLKSFTKFNGARRHFAELNFFRSKRFYVALGKILKKTSQSNEVIKLGLLFMRSSVMSEGFSAPESPRKCLKQRS